MGLIQNMVGLSYIRMEEVPAIPRWTTALGGGGVCAAGISVDLA